MAVKRIQTEKDTLYYNTFTCYKWLPLIESANAWENVYFGFSKLKELYNIDLVGYVIMPNHLHFMLYLPKGAPLINKVLGNFKRFLAYEIIKKLKAEKNNELLLILHNAVKEEERKKGQQHKVFLTSSDIKECYSENFIVQKLDYMHKNPVSGKWSLIDDYTNYIHSSAGLYERNIQSGFQVIHYLDVNK